MPAEAPGLPSATSPVENGPTSAPCGQLPAVANGGSPDRTVRSPDSTGGTPDSTCQVRQLGPHRPLGSAPERLVDVLVDDLDHLSGQLLVVGVRCRDA